MSNSAQASITIRRLRNGDNLYITLQTNGIPLYQGVDSVTGAVSPDWTTASNQPEITPYVRSARGNAVTLGEHAWKYNGVAITFDSNGLSTNSSFVGAFKLNSSTGAIRIVKNLASLTNVASDTLEYSGLATVAGLEYNISKSIDILIQPMGASAYQGLITTDSTFVSTSVKEATLTTQLICGGEYLDDYYVKWYKDDTEITTNAGNKSLKVTRDMVDGSQLFIAEFYRSSSDTNYVSRYGIRIDDLDDEYTIVQYISSSNKEVDTGSPVTVSAYIARTTDDGTTSKYTPSSVTWKSEIIDAGVADSSSNTAWTVLEKNDKDNITVSTAHTDYTAEGVAKTRDVIVMQTATF